MRWKGRQKSTNVEDRRRMSPKAAGGIGLGAIIIALIAAFIGGDVGKLLSGIQQQSPGASAPTQQRELTPEEVELGEFTKTVLRDTEVVWQDLFRRQGRQYEEPTLVLFTDRVRWAGGTASKAMGPFYSPTDKKVFIDLSFFRDLARRFKAPGDFAQAYVLAHEVGHHVQHLLGISDQVHAKRKRVSKAEYNRLSVRLELQADFFAGVWAHHAQKKFNMLEEGDIEEALKAATAIGDDTLQKQARGYAVPDSFTHGTSAQRVAWFRHGFLTGDIAQGDTFDDDQFHRITPR